MDDAAGYVMQPYYTGRWSTGEYDQEFRTNARGLRGPELGPKEPGEFRIVVIGDSMVFGGQMPEEQRFTERLEATLRSRGRRQVRVVNVGVPGWTTFNEAGYLSANMSWLEPDLVVVAVYLGNDIEENVMATIGGYETDATNGVRYGPRAREVVRNSVDWFAHNFQTGAIEYAQPILDRNEWNPAEPLPPPAGNTVRSAQRPDASPDDATADALPGAWLDAARTWLKQNSRLYRGVSDGWFWLRRGHQRPEPLVLSKWLAFTLRDSPPQYWIQVGYPLTDEYLARARDASVATGAAFVALFIPHDAQLYDAKRQAELRSYHLADDEVDLDRPRRELNERAARRGIQTIDLLPPLRTRAAGGLLTYAHDLHMTPLGHAAVADILADELDRLGALPAVCDTVR